ncbi:MAG: hypothetical protein IPK16_11880 [Anaerolineales bacterium]|nr:hypothetical protein [Anaerolineales bacterium]
MLTYHLGFPVKVLGAPLRACDTRRWQNQPHLSVSLAYLRDIFAYLDARAIHFYRLAGQLAPYVTHPDLPAFHRQLAECTTDLAAIGDLARQLRLRLTVHPAHYIQLNSPDANRVSRSTLELAVLSDLLDAMGLGLDAVIVVHVGGVYGDPLAGRDRFAHVVDRLPEAVRRRLVIEHDDRRYSFEDALWIHRRTGTPIVLDTLHLRCLNPTDRPWQPRWPRHWIVGPQTGRLKCTSAAHAPPCARFTAPRATRCNIHCPISTVIS